MTIVERHPDRNITIVHNSLFQSLQGYILYDYQKREAHTSGFGPKGADEYLI